MEVKVKRYEVEGTGAVVEFARRKVGYRLVWRVDVVRTRLPWGYTVMVSYVDRHEAMKVWRGMKWERAKMMN